MGDAEESLEDVIKLRLSIDADMGEVFASLSRTSQSRRAREAIHLMRLGAAYDLMLRTGQGAPVAPATEPRTVPVASGVAPAARSRVAAEPRPGAERPAMVGEGLPSMNRPSNDFFAVPA